MKEFFRNVQLNDPCLVNKLIFKLEEYKRRVQRNNGRSTRDGLAAEYKVHVLEFVLTNKVLSITRLCKEVENKGLASNNPLFENACGVIADYCKTGGANNVNGTGLPLL